MAFWMLFFIVLISLFFILLPMVRKSITLPQRQTVTEQPPPQEKPTEPEPGVQPQPERTPPPAVRETPQEKPAAEKPPEKPPVNQPASQPEQKPPANPPAQTSPQSGTQLANQPTAQPAQKPPETRDRTVYFMREGGGDLLLTQASRKLPVSDSPLIDCINALLAGPSAEEKNRGLASFIPPNTRLLSARVVNNTVHLNFNEAFRYNTSGREGSAAQLRQIVWTATEFPNVNNVQIEIEGNIVDFLVEGIMIRNPIGR